MSVHNKKPSPNLLRSSATFLSLICALSCNQSPKRGNFGANFYPFVILPPFFFSPSPKLIFPDFWLTPPPSQQMVPAVTQAQALTTSLEQQQQQPQQLPQSLVAGKQAPKTHLNVAKDNLWNFLLKKEM